MIGLEVNKCFERFETLFQLDSSSEHRTLTATCTSAGGVLEDTVSVDADRCLAKTSLNKSNNQSSRESISRSSDRRPSRQHCHLNLETQAIFQKCLKHGDNIEQVLEKLYDDVLVIVLNTNSIDGLLLDTSFSSCLDGYRYKDARHLQTGLNCSRTNLNCLRNWFCQTRN